MNWLIYFKNDFWFLVIQFIIIVFFIIAFAKDKMASGFARVKRGEESLKSIKKIFYIFINIFILVFISWCECIKPYRIFTFIVNTLLLFYLFFYSAWFKNKLVGFYSNINEKVDEY